MRVGIVGSLLIIIFGAFYTFNLWFPKVNNWLTPAWRQTQSVLPCVTLTLERTATSTKESTIVVPISATQTATQSPTKTKTWIPISLELDTPIGRNIQFIIHRVVEGEAIGQFASRYKTTEEAIRSVNYNLSSVLFIDQMLVIPINIIDTSDLPAFETYQVEIRGVIVSDLADQLNVESEDLSLYNNVPLDYKFNLGDWVLVPRERPQ